MPFVFPVVDGDYYFGYPCSGVVPVEFIIFGTSSISSIGSFGREKFGMSEELGGSGGVSDSLVISVSKWLSSSGSIREVSCVISLKILHSYGA